MLSPIQSFRDGLLICNMAICGGFGVIFLMCAFRNAPAGVLAPFSYFGIITALAMVKEAGLVDEVEVMVLGQPHKAKILHEPSFDPKGKNCGLRKSSTKDR